MTYQVDLNDLPVEQDAAVMQGDTYRQPYELTLNGAALSLAGTTITAAVRRRPGRGRLLVDRTVTPDDAAQGQFTLIVTATDTAGMLGGYWYEVGIVWPAGDSNFPEGLTKTVVAGPLMVREDVAH